MGKKLVMRKLVAYSLYTVSAGTYLFFFFVATLFGALPKVDAYLNQHMLMWAFVIFLLMFLPAVIAGLLMRK